MLTPLPARPSATVAAEHALRSAILSGELAPGDRLPPERELATQLGVSRLTLRAALATLSAAGLLSVRQGSGYLVRDVRETGGSDLLPGLVELARSRGTLPETVADLLRLRRHVAAAALEALVEDPPKAAARKAFSAAVDTFADAAERPDLDALVVADLGVVRALLDATGSMVLRVCLNPIVAIISEHAALRAATYSAPHENLAGWRALGAWLERPSATTIPALLAVLAERDRVSVRRLRRDARKR